MSAIKHEVKRHLAVLSTNDNTGWTKEANIVSWNGSREKLDIRDWSPDHSKMSKGITLTEDEARVLGLAIADLFKR